MKKVLILGFGEIGKSISKLYTEDYKVFTKDIEPFDIEDQISLSEGLDVLQVCIPHNDMFKQTVLGIIREFKPKLTIINSTVPPGTTRHIYSFFKLPIVHSYVTGKHPNLTESLRTFVKPVGGIDNDSTLEAVKHFNSIGVYSEPFDNPETSELAKISDTTNYLANILHMKEVHNLCKKYNANFKQAYEDATYNYNYGYEHMDSPQFMRQELKYMPGEIGGHCVIPNAIILKNVCKSKWASNLLKAYEEIMEEENDS